MSETTQPNADQPLDVQKRGSMIDLQAVRAKLAARQGPQVWRSLERGRRHAGVPRLSAS
jgi:hypothetical protein